MTKFNIFIIKLISLIIFLSISIGLERVYRSYLFTQSLSWSQQLQKSEDQLIFFKIITQFGTLPVFIPIFVIVFLWFSLNKSYAFLCTLIYSVYLNNLLKLCYGDPRPFWLKPEIFKACDGGFGNPSGHAMTSTPFYISLWNLSTDFEFFSKNVYTIILKYFILILLLCLTFAIIISRVFLGVHSLNQVLYGFTLGLAIYFTVFHLFEVNKLNARKFFNIFRTKISLIFFSLFYAILVMISILLFAYLNHETSTYDLVFSEKCPTINNFRKFNYDALFGMFTIFILIGAHYGLVFLYFLTKKKFLDKEEEINFWYIGSVKDNFFRILLLICFCLPIIMTFVIPGDLNIGLVFAFKVVVPYLITLFNVYGPLIYFTLTLGIGNKDVFINNVITIPNKNKKIQVINSKRNTYFKTHYDIEASTNKEIVIK